MDKRSPNELTAAVPKFCLALEQFRRTTDGRVRTTQEFLQHFFPHDANRSADRLFKYLPNEVRGPVLTSWGLRGAKSALKDTDDKVQSVVWDALLAGDIDHEAFEEAIVADTLIKWAPLGDWWAFWRAGKLSKLALLKALDTAYELGLFDAKWFFDTIEGPGGKLKGTDVVSEGLTKAELTEWVRKIHATGDGSPKGLLTTLGWDRIVGKTPNDVLIKVLDAFAEKTKLSDKPKGEGGGSGDKTPANGDKGAVAPTLAPTAAAVDKPAEKNERSSFAAHDEVHEPEERPSTRMTPVPAAPVDLAEATLLNAVVSARPGAKMSEPPNSSDEMVDNLFTESKLPPPEDQILVEEDVDMASPNDSPTSRPPPAGDMAMLNKPRNPPPTPSTPPLRRR